MNIQYNMENKDLNESVKRFKEILSYDTKTGESRIDEKKERHTYLMNEEEPEGEDQENADNPDFDFGGEESGEFGDESSEETDEFGTADEFSAADDIESDENSDVEEIDVTDIVKRADDAKQSAEKAVSASEQSKDMITNLMSKFDDLQKTLSKIDLVANELNHIKRDIESQKPKEKLELRSLDSYPFNVKLTDYWNDEKLKDNYEVVADAKSDDNKVKAYKIEPSDLTDYNKLDIKKSFVPESELKSKKKILNENEIWDKIRDKWFDLTFIVKSMGYGLSKFPTLYSLKKKGDKEGYDKVIEDVYTYAEKLYKKHPNHDLKNKLQELMKDLEKLDDMTYQEFHKDPSKFSTHQQDILLKGMKVTDTGIERDLSMYRVK
jgi:hypothetical protein